MQIHVEEKTSLLYESDSCSSSMIEMAFQIDLHITANIRFDCL